MALIESIRRQDASSKIFVLALDNKVHPIISSLKLENVQVFSQREIEDYEPKLLEKKIHRSRMEYIFTLTPILLKFVLRFEPEVKAVVYLDSDLYFFGSPNLVIEALGDADVGIIPHRYEPKIRQKLQKFGTYNVGWVAFQRSGNGVACLEYWAESCLSWCKDKPESGKYADQGYLDNFQLLFPSVKVLAQSEFNLAPWNTGNTQLEFFRGNLKADGRDLVFFHFHGLKKVLGIWKTAQNSYGTKLDKILRVAVYEPYVESLTAWDLRLKEFGIGTISAARRGRGIGSFLNRAISIYAALAGLASGNSFISRQSLERNRNV
jgi:hypothetical protein